MSEVKELKEEIQLDAEAVEAIAKSAMPALEAKMAELTEKLSDTITEKLDTVKTKSVADDTAGAETKTLKTGFADMPKEVRLIKGMQAVQSNDGAKIRELNATNLKLWSQKAYYPNETTDADGGYLVADPDFITEVERLEDEYGIAIQRADVRRINGNSVKMNKATSELTFTEVGEHVALNGSKITYGQVTADLRKFRVLVPATNELTEDSAIDYWNDVTGAIGRARAKLADQLVFTDATSGLLSAGVGDEYITYSVGSALSDLTLDDLLKVPTLVKSSASRNGAFYMHRTVWSQIRREVASDSGIYLLGDPANSGRTTIDGFPVYLVDVMPSTAEVGDECAFACFGDLQRVKLYIKNQVDFKMYDQAVVLDSNGDQFNLATQDGEAISARTRMLATKGFESAFVIIGTDSVS